MGRLLGRMSRCSLFLLPSLLFLPTLLLRRRVGSFLGYLRLLGPSLLARRRQRRGQVVTDADLVAWMEPQ